ncbi:MAG: tetratricopeptide repeat protein [Elusimicrobiota bacterium]
MKKLFGKGLLTLFLTSSLFSAIPAEQKNIDDGKKYLKEGNYQTAIDNFVEALSINPKNKEAQVLLNKITVQLQKKVDKFSTAMKAYQSKDYETATEYLIELLEENPRNEKAIALITKINNSIIEIKRQKIKKEEQERKKVIQSVKKEREKMKRIVNFTKKEVKKIAKSFYKKGLEYYKKGDYGLAIPEFDNALVWQPGNAEIKNKIKEATQKSDIINKGQIIQQSVEKADDLYRNGDLLNSLDEWIIVLELEPSHQQAKEYIQKITTVLSETQKEQHKKEIIDKREEVVERLLRRGNALFYQKKYKEAIENWEKIFKIEPNNQSVKQKIATAKEQIVIIEEKTSNVQKASSILGEKKKVDTKKIEQLYYISADYYMNGQYDRAKKILGEILKLDPANENAGKLMARVESVLDVLR